MPDGGAAAEAHHAAGHSLLPASPSRLRSTTRLGLFIRGSLQAIYVPGLYARFFKVVNGTQPWNSMSGGACSNLGHVPKDMNGGAPVTTTNYSGPSIGVSSLVTDANKSLSGGAQLQPSTSMNVDSFMRVPASPMSFSSNNISGSSVVDNSIMQQSPPQEQMQKRRSSSVTSQPVYEASGALHTQKKSRIDARQDDILQHQLI